MKTGLLWLDNDPDADLLEKISRAVAYYQQKYGCKPNICFVHPRLSEKVLPNADGILIKTDKHLLPNYLWVGITGPDPAVYNHRY